MRQYTLSEFSNFDCPDCNREFDSKMGLMVHHGKIHDGSLSGVTVRCSHCGTEKTTHPYRAKEQEHHFCDFQCKGEWQSDNRSGEQHPNWNPYHTECEICGTSYTVVQSSAETTRFCSNECQMKALSKLHRGKIGSDHQNWRGGVSTYIALRRCLGPRCWQYIAEQYRESVGCLCEWCGSPSPGDRSLDVHHIVPMRTGGTHHTDNLMALCRSCHSTIERFTDRLFNEVLVDEFDTGPVVKEID